MFPYQYDCSVKLVLHFKILIIYKSTHGLVIIKAQECAFLDLISRVNEFLVGIKFIPFFFFFQKSTI